MGLALNPVLDPGAAARLRRVGGDRLLRELIELFLQLGEERLRAAGSADAEAAGRAAHSLKSAAGNLGATALQAAAGAAEATAVEPSSAEHRAAVAALVRAFGDAERELRRMLGELEP